MTAFNSWNSEGSYSHFWEWRPQRWQGKRTRLVDKLTMRHADTPNDVQSPRSALVDFPPKPILQIHLWTEWISTQVRTYVRALTDETKVLVTQLTDADAAVNTDRAWEVDLVRGGTISLMVLFHTIPKVASLAFLWTFLKAVRLLFYVPIGATLAYFGLSLSTAEEANATTAFVKWGRRGLNALALLLAWFFIHGTQLTVLGEMFAGIMGISLLLGYENRRRRTGQAPSFRQQVAKALPLMIEGALLTIPFAFLGPNAAFLASLFVMLGLSQILAYPFLARSRWRSFTVGLAAIGLVSVPLVAALTPNLIYLLLGLPLASPYASFLPWFGATLLGVFIGKTLYDQGERRFELPDIAKKKPVRQLIVIGQHARLIFLLHLPVTATWPLYKRPGLQLAGKLPYPFQFV